MSSPVKGLLAGPYAQVPAGTRSLPPGLAVPAQTGTLMIGIHAVGRAKAAGVVGVHSLLSRKNPAGPVVGISTEPEPLTSVHWGGKTAGLDCNTVPAGTVSFRLFLSMKSWRRNGLK
jgi:hypothetical protein